MAITKLTKVDPNHIHENHHEPKDEAPKRKTNFCKRFMKFMFSHIGLVLIILIWASIGGFLFKLLEEHNEIKSCETGKGQESGNIVTLRSKLLTYIQFNITSNPAETGKDNETVANENIESWLTEFRKDCYDNFQSNLYYGQNCNYPRWNFTQALLFSLTAITTIGYGHIAPKTWEGEVVCICYSVIGIPFVLMCVANISGVLGDMFRYVYARICCRLCMKKKPPNQRFPNQYDHDIATARDVTPVWGPDSEINQKPPIYNKQNPGVVDDSPLEDEEDKVAVPLTVTMLIILAYLGIGGVIYMNTEDWSYVQSIYFCFVTLSTIGFGDFVPGQKANYGIADGAIYRVIGGFFYILIGMAVIAMSFDLMQDEIVTKCTWVGRKLGVIDPEPTDSANVPDNDNYTELNKVKKDVASYINGSDTGRVSYHNDSLPSSRVASTEPLNQKSEIISKSRNAYFQNLPVSRIQSKN